MATSEGGKASMLATELYPWFSEHWRRWIQQVQMHRLPNAMLLAGASGLGKRTIAFRFAQYLLCTHPVSDSACGQCKGCQLQQAHSHPDYLYIHPEEGSRSVKIDQIRQLSEFIQSTPQISQRRVVIIEPAETMNLYAANALLKTLEEPPGAATIMLISEQLSLLLPTIRSRCQITRLGLPDTAQASQWLAECTGLGRKDTEELLHQAGGQPLTALAWQDSRQFQNRQALLEQWVGYMKGAEDAFTIAAQWTKVDTNWLLVWLGACLRDLLRARQDAEFALSEPLQSCADKWSVGTIWCLYQELMEIKQHLLQQRNLNMQLVLENWLLLNKKKC